MVSKSTAIGLVVMLLASDAWAQVSGQVSTEGARAPLAAQASFDTGYLLANYMAQLASAGTPVTQADIDHAASIYLTNGAAATGVPTSGPQATYFQNGAQATTVPTSGPGAAYYQNGAALLAYPTPAAAPTQAATAQVAGEAAPTGTPTAPPAASASPPTDQVPAPGAPATPTEGSPQNASGFSASTGLTCSPREIEAAMALASQFATSTMAATSAPATAPPAAPPTPPTQAAAPPSAPAPVETGTRTADTALVTALSDVVCPAAPSAVWRILPGILGAVLGGLAVALWSRPRAFRAQLRGKPDV